MKLIKTLALCALSAACLPAQTSAQLDKKYFKKLYKERVESTESVAWTQLAPGNSGYCEGLWCHPTDSKVMFQGPDMHISYGSWDDGQSWQSIKDPDGTGFEMRRVTDMAFSLQNPDFGMSIHWDGKVYVTKDKGRSWQLIAHPTKRNSVISVDPTNDQTWYIGSGDFWNIKDNHRTLKNGLHGTILKKSDYGYVLKSTNGGKSWKKMTKGLPKTLDVGRICVDPRDPNTVVIASGHGVFRSTDSGQSWKPSNKGLPYPLVRDMRSHYDAKTKKYILFALMQTKYTPDGKGSVTTDGGLYKSLDGGQTWNDITGDLYIDLQQIHHTSMRNNSYHKLLSKFMGMPQGACKKQYPTLPKKTFTIWNKMVVDSANPDIIYISNNAKHSLGFQLSEVWKTEDGGKHWVAVTRQGKYWSSAIDKEYWSSRKQPMGTNITMNHLRDEMAHASYPQGNRALAINVKGDVFCGIDQQTLRTNDGGKTWFAIDDYELTPGSGEWVGRGDSNLPGRFILLETGIPGRHLFCSGEHGLWENARYDNAGLTAKGEYPMRQIEGQIHPGKGAHSIASVAVDPKDPKHIFMLMFRQKHRDYLRETRDGGKTWKNLSKPVDPKDNKVYGSANIYQNSLMIDPDNTQNMYFVVMRSSVTDINSGKRRKGFKDYGVYKSQDAGKTWNTSNEGLPKMCSINRIIMDPKDPQRIFAACNKVWKGKGGLYVSYDGAGYWEKMDIPDEITAVNNVSIDKNGTIYIACGNRTADKYSGGVWKSTDDGKKWKRIFNAPNVWQCQPSPLDPNILIVSSAETTEYGDNTPYLNPGCFISHNGGKTWEKVNKGLASPNKAVYVTPDNHDKNVFWCAMWGGGWARGVYSKK